MFDPQKMAGCVSVLAGKIEQGPFTPLVLVIGPEADLISPRFNLIDFFIAVVFAMDKSVEEAAGFGTQHIFENAGLEIVLEFVAGRVLAVPEQARIAANRRRGAAFFDFVISRIGEAEDGLDKLLAELIFLGQQLQTPAFRFGRRIENEIAVANKNRARDLALHRIHKAHRTRMQMERAAVALQFEVRNADRLAAECKVAKLLVNWVRIGRSGWSSC